MGTSLSGLTPATTFDGLLKVGDNDPLTADLKAISTGDGSDTILQLSTTALQIGGATTINGAQMTIVGAGNDAETTSLLVQNSAGTNLLKVDDAGSATAVGFKTTALTINSNQILGSSGIRLRTTTASQGGTSMSTADGAPANTMCYIKGFGASADTTSLLVQNSAGYDLFSITDNGLFTFNDDGGGDALTIENGSNISQIRYNDNLWLGSSHGTYSPIIKIDRTAGLSVETNSGSLLNLLYDTGNLGIGETTPTARLHIKGEAPSGDPLNNPTALLVENSAGSELFKVQDDGRVDFGSLFALGTNIFGTNSSYRINIAGANEYQTYDSHIFKTHDGVGYNESMRILGNGASSKVGIGEPTPTARLHIKGSGNDNTTTSLLVQNSDGLDMLEVDDSGNVGIGDPNPLSATLHISSQSYFNNTTALRIQNSIGNNLFRIKGDGTTDIINSKYIFNQSGVSTGGAIFKGSGNDNTTTALLVQNSDGADLFSVRDDGKVNADNDIYVQGAIYGGSNTKLRVGTDLNVASTRAWIQGLGATSATTALLVQNSAGTDLLKVTDDGDVNIDNGVAADMKVRISPTTNKYLEIDRQSRQVRYYSGASGNAGIYMVQADKFSIGTNNASLVLLDENSNVRIGSGTAAADTSAKLQVDSTTQGFLPPRMTDAERDAITSPAPGLMVYDTSNNQMNYWNGTTWIAF